MSLAEINENVGLPQSLSTVANNVLFQWIQPGMQRSIFPNTSKISYACASPINSACDAKLAGSATTNFIEIPTVAAATISIGNDAQVREILVGVKPLAAEYYRLTGNPLGVTGEVSEYVATETLGLKLVAARTIGYDALRGEERMQIKGRAYGARTKPGQRISRIKLDAPCDTVCRADPGRNRLGLRIRIDVVTYVFRSDCGHQKKSESLFVTPENAKQWRA
jgi:hypothetical protein